MAGLVASIGVRPASSALSVQLVASVATAHVRLLRDLLSSVASVGDPGPGWPGDGAVVTIDHDIPSGWTPMSLLDMSPMVIVARADAPIAEATDLVDWLRQSRRRIVAATHCERSAAMALADAAGVTLTGVHSAGVTTHAIRSKAADIACVTAADALDAVRQGDLRAFVVAGEDGIAALWDAPSAVDAGLPLFSAAAWSGLYVRGDGQGWMERLDRLRADPATQTRLSDAGHTLPPTSHRTADAHAALLASTRERYDALTRATGMTFV